MNSTGVLLFISALISAHIYLQYTGSNNFGSVENQEELKVLFENWAQSYGKAYKTDSEKFYRLNIFLESLNQVREHKKLGKSYTLGLTSFADMTDEEFSQTILMRTRDTRHGTQTQQVSGEKYISGYLNWVDQGAVNPIQNQGSCGSCYTFATAAATEGASALQSPYGLQKFSEQQLVSCSQSYGNEGCNGGFGQYAFSYVIDHGLTYESLYPYVSGNGQVPECEINRGVFYISSFKNVVGRGSCTKIQEQVSNQPVYGRVNADNWKLYTSGVYDGSTCSTNPNDIDHAITVVGFNTTSTVESQRYWIIRNSWGTGWGENGYMKLKYGNSCSICYEVFAPIY